MKKFLYVGLLTLKLSLLSAAVLGTSSCRGHDFEQEFPSDAPYPGPTGTPGPHEDDDDHCDC